MVENKGLSESEIVTRMQERLKNVPFKPGAPIAGGLTPNKADLWIGDPNYAPPASDLVFAPASSGQVESEKKTTKRT